MNQDKNILNAADADPVSIFEESEDDNFAEINGTSTGVSHKRFYETHDDLSRIVHELKTVQSLNERRCLRLYKYMTSFMKHQGGEDILKRRRVNSPHQQIQKHKSKYAEESILQHLKLGLQKLGESKDDLTYIISQIKFFSIGYKHYHGRSAQIDTDGILQKEDPALITEKEPIVEEPETENLVAEKQLIVKEPDRPNLWETLMEKLKNSTENEILFETRYVRVERLTLQDSATMFLDKQRKKRKIVMTKKKESLLTGKRKLVRRQIGETPPWRWGNNGHYFENVPNVPFVWRLIFAELDDTDKHNIRLVSRHWKAILECYYHFVYNAVLTDDTLSQIDASLYEFNSLSIGPLLSKIPESWQPGCFSEVRKLTFKSSVSQENIEKLSVLFQHLPYLACENSIGFRWLMPNINGFHDARPDKSLLCPQPFGGQHLKKFELSFTTFSPWQCAVFIEMVISDFPCLEDFTVKYIIDEKSNFGWSGQERNHFYEVYLSVFTFIAIHLHTLKKVTLWLAIMSTMEYDTLPFGNDLPWIPGFPNYEELIATLGAGSLEEVHVHLCPWEQRGVYFWTLCLKLIQSQSTLKKVTIQNMGYIAAADPLFQKSSASLESVSIKYPVEPFSCELISQCTNLREFTFVDKLWKMDRLNDIDVIPLSVQKITLDTFMYKLPDPVESWILENLTNLEDLVLSGWAHADVAVTYLALPKLKTLTIQNCFPSSVTTIKELCKSHSPEVRFCYQKKRTCATGELIIRIIRHDRHDIPTE